MSHAHGHGHAGHAHIHLEGEGHAKRVRLALMVTGAFLLLEVVGGWLANSLALLADAGHMFTDVAALSLSLFVIWFTRQPVTANKSYGDLRWEIIAALINGSALLLMCVWIIWEAVGRFRVPEPVDAGLMAIVATVGLCANVGAAVILHPAAGSSLNVRGAYLHVMGDLISSVGTMVAAAVIALTAFTLADPIASLLTAALIVRGAWRLVRESVDVLLESTPSHISAGDVRQQLEAIPGIESVHDLHIWSVSTGMVAMSAHAIVREPHKQQHVLEHIHDAMRLFGIHHVTVQLEQREMFERELHLHE